MRREKKRERKKKTFGDYVGVKESFRMNEKNESEKEVKGSHKREDILVLRLLLFITKLHNLLGSG